VLRIDVPAFEVADAVARTPVDDVPNRELDESDRPGAGMEREEHLARLAPVAREDR
jgi:hypothetical protein